MTSESRTRVVIGLDVGTTGVKAVAFGVGHPFRYRAIREYPLLRPAPGQEVQDPATIEAAARDALVECVSASEGAEVLALSLSAAMHGVIALGEDLAPITPLVTWADGRAAEEARDLARSPGGAQLRATTGAPLHPMTPLAKVMWFARHDPATWSAARWWVGLKDHLLLRLTGTLATELSSASGTGMLDATTRQWSPVALDACGLAADRLPPILPTTAVLQLEPGTAAAVGLPRGTPVVVGAGDGPLANLGTGAITPGVAALSLGTSGAVRIPVEGPHIDRTGDLFCYALTDSLWVAGGAVSNGADVVRWAGQALTPDLTATAGRAGADAAVLDLAAGVEPGSGGLVMLPFLLPERAPIWGPGTSGAFLGLRRDHTRAHMVRAAVEGVCLQLGRILRRLEGVAPVGSVRATGGAFQSRLWREVMAAAAGRPFHVLDGSEGTALGAAALGVHALDPSASLVDALGRLGFPSHPPPAVRPPSGLVTALDQVGHRTEELLGGLARATGSRLRPPPGTA